MKKRQIRYGKVVTLRLSEDLWQLVREEADYDYTTPSTVIRKAVARHYESMGKLQRKKP